MLCNAALLRVSVVCMRWHDQWYCPTQTLFSSVC